MTYLYVYKWNIVAAQSLMGLPFLSKTDAVDLCKESLQNPAADSCVRIIGPSPFCGAEPVCTVRLFFGILALVTPSTVTKEFWSRHQSSTQLNKSDFNLHVYVKVWGIWYNFLCVCVYAHVYTYTHFCVWIYICMRIYKHI